jgi:hypothetical protein
MYLLLVNLNLLNNSEKIKRQRKKKDFIRFIKDQFGETIAYDQERYPLYFDEDGNMKRYDLEEGYIMFKKSINE